MKGFPFVESNKHAPTEGWIIDIFKNMPGLGNTPDFLERLLKRILSLHRLEARDQQGRAKQSIFEGGGNPIEVIPMLNNQPIANILLEGGSEHAIVGSSSCPIER